MASAQGLDVSDYQGRFNWAAAVKDVPDLCFGTFRLTQGLGGPGTSSPDPDALWNHVEIRDNGLHRGTYHFLDPALSGSAQANYFVEQNDLLGLVKDDLLFLDNETNGSSAGAVAECAQAFMAELVSLRPQNPVGVYTYIDFAKEGNCEGLSQYPLWLAYPALDAPAPPPPWTAWTFWQWGTRNGVDADAFNGTAADLDAFIARYTASSPSGPPYRHTTTAGQTLGAIASSRNTTPERTLQRTAAAYTAADVADLAAIELPAGVPYYTANP